SHVWLSYGPVLEHVFISPAQHQIHHSRAVRHHNKNYGEIFAFWDWMFGTLYVPKRHEVLEFGLADAAGRAIEQPHPTLARALFVPFVESWQAIRTRDPEPAAEATAPLKTDQPGRT
ncbi:MAG: sterol desaturase family protein, partial [Pseudomonadota bacterium]